MKLVLSTNPIHTVWNPVAQVKNDQADDLEKAAAEDFVKFLVSDQAKAIFDKYYFDTNVEN